MTPKQAFRKAVKVVGGPSAMARALGYSPNRIGNWMKRGMPEDEALAVEKATADHGTEVVTKEQLAPRLYRPVPKERRPRAPAVHA